MTDRIQGFVVSLDKEIREDDIEYIVNAIRMIKHVESVEPIKADPYYDVMEMRINAAVRTELYTIARDFDAARHAK